MAPLCAERGIVWNLEQFMKYISKIRHSKLTAPGKIVNSPGFSKVNWALIGDGSNLSVL